MNANRPKWRSKGGRTSQFQRNIAAGSGSTITMALATIAAYPVYLHYLGYERYGLWTMLATIAAAVQLCHLGVLQALVPAVAERAVRGDLPSIRRLWGSAEAVVVTVGVMGCLMLAILRVEVRDVLAVPAAGWMEFAQLLPWALAASVWALVAQVPNAVVVGLGRADRANGISVASRLTGIAASAALLWAGFGLAAMIAGTAAAAAVLHLGSSRMAASLSKSPNAINLLRATWTDSKLVVTSGLPLFGTSLANLFLQPLNRVIIAREGGMTAVTVWELCFGAAMQVRALGEGGLRALTPEVAQIIGRGRRRDSTRATLLLARIERRVTTIGAIALMGLVVLAPTILKLWLGNRYAEGLDSVLRVTLVGAYISVIGVPSYYFLLGLQMTRVVLFAHVLQSALNLGVLLFVATRVEEASVSLLGLGWVAGASGATIALVGFAKAAKLRPKVGEFRSNGSAIK